MGFKRTNLAKSVAGQLLASNEHRKPPHWTNVAFASLYNDSVSKLMSKVGTIQFAAKSAQPSYTLLSIGQMINHFNSKESDVVTYVPDGQHSFVENHYGVDGVSVVLKCEDDLTTHRIVFKWNHCFNYKYLDRNRHEFDQDIMSTCDLLCLLFARVFPLLFDFAKKTSLLAFTFDYSRTWAGGRLIIVAIPPCMQSNPFTSTSTSLELYLPRTIDTQNLYCLIHMLPAPWYSESTNSKGKFITSKGKLTTFPNSSRHPCNRRGSVYTSGAQINHPYHLKKQNKIDQEHIKHQNTADGNLDSSGIKKLDKLTNTNSTSQSNGLRHRILLNNYDQCFFDETNFGNSMDGGGIILQDRESGFKLAVQSWKRMSMSRQTQNQHPITQVITDVGLVDSRDSSHSQTLDEISIGAGSTDVGSVDLPVSMHSQTLDEIRISAGSTDVASVNLSAHSQTLDEICMGAGSTDVASVNLSADTDDIQRAAKSLVGIKPHKDCTPSIDKDTSNISQPVGKNLTQTSLLDLHESNLSQSTAAALLVIMGSDSDKSKQTASIPCKPLAPNLVPPPESPLDSIDSNSGDSLPPPIFPPNPPAQIHKLTTNAPASRPIQSPASALNFVSLKPAISQSDSTSMIHSLSFLLTKSYNLEKTEMKQVLENIVIGEQPVSNQEAPKLSKAVCGLFNNHQGIMTPTALNVLVDLFNHQSILPDCVRPHFF
eukprot:jgi/Psemu1/25182/gm1.25182_g